MEEIFLLTGAAGNLGSSILQSLLLRGKKVRALVLPNDPALSRLPKEAEIVEGDITQAGTLNALFKDLQDYRVIVIHCASIVALRPEYSQKVYDVNVVGTINVVDKCIQYGADKLVYVSSTGAIPELPKGNKIVEVDTFDKSKVISCYAQTKAEATQYVLDVSKDGKLNASVVFPSGILGPNDYSYGLFTRFAITYAKGKLPIGVGGSFNAVDVRDLADAVIACAEKGKNGEGYIIANKTVDFKYLIGCFQKYTNGRKIRFFAPLWLAKVGVFFISVWGKITRKPSWLTMFTIYNLSRNNDYSCEKAINELGVAIRPLEETVRDTIEWLRKEGKI